MRGSWTLACAVIATTALASPYAAALVVPPNLFVNGEFDADLAGWGNIDPTKTWNAFDDADDPASGSILISHAGNAGSGYFIEQCVPVQGGVEYAFQFSHFSSGFDAAGRADAALYWFTNAECSGMSIGFEGYYSDPTGVWTTVADLVAAPESATAVELLLSANKTTGSVGDPWNVYFDHVRLPEPASGSASLVAIAALAAGARRSGRRGRSR